MGTMGLRLLWLSVELVDQTPAEQVAASQQAVDLEHIILQFLGGDVGVAPQHHAQDEGCREDGDGG